MRIRLLRALLAVYVGLSAHAAIAAELTTRMALTEAIQAVQAEGYELIYSSKLVKPWMRVRSAPSTDDALLALGEALKPYALALAPGPDNRWLIIEGEPPQIVPEWMLEGRVVDAFSNEPLTATVELGGLTVATAPNGKFSLQRLTADRYELRFIAAGYEPTTRDVSIDDLGVELTVVMQPFVEPALEEVTLVASRYALFDEPISGEHFLTGEEIRRLPHLADDVYRAFHRLPGVAASDFSAPFNLRGGARDEVTVIIDGLELFEPFHMRQQFSPLSIIDPGIIDQAQVLSGGLTSEYGNYMSGVVDITSRLPSDTPLHEVGVSFVHAFARTQGSYADGRANYLLSGRRGYLDLITDELVDEGEELKPRYQDVFAKTSFAISDHVELAGSVIAASDDVRFTDSTDGEVFGGDSSLGYAWLTVDAGMSDSVSTRSLAFVGDVEITADGLQDNPPPEEITRFDRREVDILGLQSDWSFAPDDRNVLKWGARFRHLEADYDYRLDSIRRTALSSTGAGLVTQRNIMTSRDGDEWGVYVALRRQDFSNLLWELGVRWDKQTYLDLDDDSQLSPRFNASYRLSDRTRLRAAWGKFHQPQGIQDLQVQDGVTEFFPTQQAEHRILGVGHMFPGHIELRADVYEKRYTDLRPRYENVLDIYEFAAESNFDRVRVEPESALARGVELTLRRRRPMGFDWWLSYTWSNAEDEIEGVDIPRSWDQRHAATASLTWQGERWSFSAVGRFRSGWPRTPLSVGPILDSGGILVGIDTDLSQRNSARYDDYTRLDLRLARRVPTRRGEFELFLEVFNVFDASNDCCVMDHDLVLTPTVSATPSIDSYLPFFPSFGFAWTFGPDH